MSNRRAASKFLRRSAGIEAAFASGRSFQSTPPARPVCRTPVSQVPPSQTPSSQTDTTKSLSPENPDDLAHVRRWLGAK